VRDEGVYEKMLSKFKRGERRESVCVLCVCVCVCVVSNCV